MKHWHFGGRESGKTDHLINAVLQRAAEGDEPNTHVLVITRNAKDSHVIRQEIESAWVKRRGPEWVGSGYSDGRLELDAGERTATIYFAFGTSVSIRDYIGYRIHFVAGDEYQSWDPDAYPTYEAMLRRQTERPDEWLTISERE